MAIPDFQSMMFPLMKYSSDGKEHALRENIEYLAREFNQNGLFLIIHLFPYSNTE